jgi:hypothetical protein
MDNSCGRYGAKIGAYRVLVKKPKMKKPIGRTRNIWKSNNKVDL